ncbi:MAG: phosphoribosylamine--glycine ligase, partial [Gemmatimonadaceae bacterium]
MKLLLIGGGGREHALAWKFVQDDPQIDLMAAPGNPGIATLARCFPIRSDDVAGLLALARAERPDVTVIGPEAPLAAGIVDRFRDAGLAVFGPVQAAARIETSKRFAKELMLRAGVPTARASHHTAAASARRAAADMGAPVVIKASGLAGGKGVVVARTGAEADRAIAAMLEQGAFGDAGHEILVEEFMDGEELSVFALCDGSGA